MMGIIREKKRRKERTGSPVFLITLTKNSNIQLARQTIVSVVCFFIVQTLIFMHETGKISIDFFKECIMQDIPMSRWLSPLMAFCLSFVIIVLWHQPWESRLIVKSISGYCGLALCCYWHYQFVI